MPVLIPAYLWMISGLGLGAFFGAQVDDKLEPTTHPSNMQAGAVNWNKVIIYAGAGLLLAYGAKKLIK